MCTILQQDPCALYCNMWATAIPQLTLTLIQRLRKTHARYTATCELPQYGSSQYPYHITAQALHKSRTGAVPKLCTPYYITFHKCSKHHISPVHNLKISQVFFSHTNIFETPIIVHWIYYKFLFLFFFQQKSTMFHNINPI